MGLPQVSLCSITGNEAATIERFLDSFSAAFDELCLVRAIGTLTHDRTLSIAKEWCGKHGKKFVAGEYRNASNDTGRGLGEIDESNPATWPHVDDFSAARNVAWALATNPWQLWADVDDLLEKPMGDKPGGAELIRLCVAAGTHDQFLFSYALRTQSEVCIRERLFRTGISKWINPVHEQCRLCVEPPAGKKWKGCIEQGVIFSHAPQHEKERDPMRNRRIMAYHTRWIHAYAFELHREFFYDWQHSRRPEDAEQATKWAELAHQTECMPEQRFDMLLQQAQIAAVKDVDHAIDLCWSAIRIQPKNRAGWGDLAGYELRAGRGGRAAQATAFMQSLPKPPSNGYPLSERYHGWEGAHLRAQTLRAAGQEDMARRHEDALFAANGKRISLLHATRGRPAQALEARSNWFRAALVPLGIEHIFAIDADDAESLAALKNYRHVIVTEPRGCVKAWNAAAAECSGAVLMQLSDDWIPCHDWDALVWDALEAGALEKRGDKSIKLVVGETARIVRETPLVLAVHDNHRNDALLCMAILTRARYEVQFDPVASVTVGSVTINRGTPYLFAPDYFGVFSDNEFTVRAYDDGVVVQAQHIVFDHRHPIFLGVPVEKWDATHLRQNAPERYAEGKEIYNRRNPKHAIP